MDKQLHGADQLRGPAVPCQWIEFGRVPVDGGDVAACRLAGSRSNRLMTPDGWAYAGSLSETFGYIPRRPPRRVKALVR
jgi:hypothetical protein